MARLALSLVPRVNVIRAHGAIEARRLRLLDLGEHEAWRELLMGGVIANARHAWLSSSLPRSGSGVVGDVGDGASFGFIDATFTWRVVAAVAQVVRSFHRKCDHSRLQPGGRARRTCSRSG